MFRTTLARAACFLLLVTASSWAADEAAIEELLRREIIGPDLALAEVQAFADREIPRMPQVESLEQWKDSAQRMRQRVLDEVVFRGEAAKWRELETRVEWLEAIEGGPGYRIKTLRYEAVPGLWIPALLYEPTDLVGKVPAVMNVNGHDRGNGKAAKYKQLRCINLAKRGMIALNLEWVGMGQLNVPGNSHYKMNQLDLCGTSGLAPFYLSMSRGLDILLAHENADPARVAVAGLSGGGWQTIFISSLDTRVTLANPVAGYSSFLTRIRHFKDLGDSEQTPNDLATVADYTHLTAMLAPRAALLTYNEKDNCCFESPYALPPLLDAARPIYKLHQKEGRLRSHVNSDPGDHNFGIDNRQALYRMLRDHFYKGDDAKCSAVEIGADGEVKTKDELTVPIPQNNVTFQSLAANLAKELPRSSELPQSAQGARRWQGEAQAELRRITRAMTGMLRYDCRGREHATSKLDGTAVKHWRLKITNEAGHAWTVPAVEFAPTDPKATVMIVSDQGRAATAGAVASQLAKGNRVLAVDPFYFGESKIRERDFLFAFVVATVGHRPLGIQASQLVAVAQWLKERFPDNLVVLHAEGPRSSLFSLVAAAIHRDPFDRVEVTGSFGSLKEIIESDMAANRYPELFCFGLLEKFDVLQIAAIVAPKRVVFLEPSERAKQELALLARWYTLFDSTHDPLR